MKNSWVLTDGAGEMMNDRTGNTSYPFFKKVYQSEPRMDTKVVKLNHTFYTYFEYRNKHHYCFYNTRCSYSTQHRSSLLIFGMECMDSMDSMDKPYLMRGLVDYNFHVVAPCVWFKGVI